MRPEPAWIQKDVLYEIYIRCFLDHNGDGTGDFAGITDRLDYIARLGVRSILLNCPFLAQRERDRHPLVDWMKVDPDLGNLSDFLLLIEKAHARGLRVLISLPVNATSIEHIWFRESRQKKPRFMKKSYFWSEEAPSEPEAENVSPEKANWSQDAESLRYYWFQDRKNEPALNYADPEIMEEMRRVFEHWFTLGVDGFRLAGAGRLHVFKNRSIEPLPDPFRTFLPVTEPLRKIFPDRVFLFGTETPPSRKTGLSDPNTYFHFGSFFPSVLDAVKNEDKGALDTLIITSPEIRSARKDGTIRWTIDHRARSEDTFEKFDSDGAGEIPLPVNDLGPPRPILARLAGSMENGRRRIQLVMSLSLTFPGIPVLYYGDEIGMGDNPHLPGKKPIRTPMQWSADRNAGFSRADPEELYSTVIDDPPFSYTMVNVESQERFPDSHLWHVRLMIDIRNGQPALWSDGIFETVETTHPAMLAFIRSRGDTVCLLIHNLSKSAICGLLKLSLWEGLVPRELLGGVRFPRIGKSPYLVTMTPYSYIWFLLEKPSPGNGTGTEGAAP